MCVYERERERESRGWERRERESRGWGRESRQWEREWERERERGNGSVCVRETK